MKLKDFISVKFLAIGLAYTTLFHSVWLFSTQFEIISGTVSWYLPAGVRLAAFLMLPLHHNHFPEKHYYVQTPGAGTYNNLNLFKSLRFLTSGSILYKKTGTV